MEAPRYFRLSLRTLLEVIAVIAVVLAFAYQRSGTTARFQIMSAQYGTNSNVFLYDSATGRVWQWDGYSSWTQQTPADIGK